MTDMADYLQERARLLAHVHHGIPNVWFTGATHYDWHEHLSVGEFDSGKIVRYHRPKDWQRSVEFNNIREDGVRDREVTEIPVGDKKLIDTLTAASMLYGKPVDIPLTYEGEFRKLRGMREAFNHGLTQSLETAFKFAQGGDASFAKSEQEIKIGFEARQDWENETSSEDEVRRLVGLNPVGPAGWDIEFYLYRYVQEMKIRVEAKGNVDHSVQIGKYHSKDGWEGNRGKHKVWKRWAYYDSFRKTCLPVLKREAPRNFPLAKWFKNNPVPDWIIHRLERPLDVPFNHTSDVFDGATKVEFGQRVLREPEEQKDG